MYPHERSLVKQLAGLPFSLIGVNGDDDRDELKKVVREKNLSWRSFWNGPEGPHGPISTRWNVESWPVIYILDAKGVIRYKNIRGAEMDRAIETLLRELGHEVKIDFDHDESEGPENG